MRFQVRRCEGLRFKTINQFINAPIRPKSFRVISMSYNQAINRLERQRQDQGILTIIRVIALPNTDLHKSN